MSIYIFKFVLVLSLVVMVITTATKVARNSDFTSRIRNALADPVPNSGGHSGSAPRFNSKWTQRHAPKGEGSADISEPVNVKAGYEAARLQYPDASN